jgi:hypothetical protein
MADESTESLALPGDPWNEDSDTNIGALLDIGYDQLDGFVNWLEEQAGISTRIAQQDCFNAECLLDNLANHHRKTVEQINEFDLRWFLFSHYIRKAQADSETEERLTDSLFRFFTYLRSEHAFQVPDWVFNTLDDRAFYLKRRRDYAELDNVDERAWEEGFRDWCAELEEDLEIRCLWLPNDELLGIARADLMGWREATLHDEANDLWQSQRDHLLRSGQDYDTIREHLTEAYLQWANAPQDRLEGQTPREVILAERLERSKE